MTPKHLALPQYIYSLKGSPNSPLILIISNVILSYKIPSSF